MERAVGVGMAEAPTIGGVGEAKGGNHTRSAKPNGLIQKSVHTPNREERLPSPKGFSSV